MTDGLWTIDHAGARMRLAEQEGLSFVSSSGAAWQLRGPLFVVHYYDRQHPRAQSVDVPRHETVSMGTAGTPSLGAQGRYHCSVAGPRELTLRLDLPGAEVQIDGRVVLNDDGEGFIVQLTDVREGRPDLYRLLSIEVLPMFGAARTGEEGYLVLPNWLGCQTFFDKTYPREARQTIYSSNDEWEHVCNMSMFGIVREQGTLCGIVSEGDVDARLISRVHWEQQHLNAVHSEVVYRWQEDDAVLPGPREIRYHTAPADHATGEGYAFCGVTYRAFLQASRGLQTFVQKQETRPAACDYLQNFMLKIFMGYKDPQEDGGGAFHSTCTFDEARQILQKLLDRGVRRITAILVGWNQDGHDGMYPTRFPVDERQGGEAGLRRLNAWCAEHGITLAVHDNQLSMYTASPEFDLSEAIHHRNGEPWGGIIWSGGRCFLLSPTVAVSKYAPRDMARLADVGLYGHHHIDAVGSFMPDHSPDHPLPTRQAYIEEVRRLWQLTIDHLGSASTEYPFGPYFDLVDGYFASYSSPHPWHRASALARHFLDRTIPLLSIVLHGCVKCCEPSIRSESARMRLLGLGLAPQAEVCQRPAKPFGVGTYTEQADEIEAAYCLFHDPDSEVASLAWRMIDSYREIPGGGREIGFDDGTTLQVSSVDGAAAPTFRVVGKQEAQTLDV